MKKLTLFVAASAACVFVLTACSGSVPEVTAETPYVSALQPLNNPNIQSLPAPDGRTPCGVFDLATSGPQSGWGFKTADLTSWPDCQSHAPSLEILCLNGDAQWVVPAFEDLSVSTDGLQLSWTSKQDGVCGFFATQ